LEKATMPRTLLLACWVSLAAPALAQTTPATRALVSRGAVQIEVVTQGAGPAIVILPSLGRGGADYDAVSARLAANGFRVVRPEPRGVGRSIGPMTGLSLHDYAADVATVIECEHTGPVVVVGHAFGNFVARMLATDRPDLVRGVVIAAGSPGKVPAGVVEKPIGPELRAAIDGAGDLELPEAKRVEFLQLALFAPGHDARLWLSGWYPAAVAAEGAARDATPVDTYFAAGRAPVLDMQAEDDPVAPRRFAGVLKSALGDRVTIAVIPRASHALTPEQPAAMADAIATFAKGLPPS
jgi:pimeloyl-ACP methyl ester carboxylesterase